jgi:spore germination cell wall hydrolase CwlJ-like protein
MRKIEVIGVIIGCTIVVAQLKTIGMIASTNDHVDELNDRVSELERVVSYKVNAIHLSEQDRECLARNVFYEAGNQPAAGQIAVAQVTLNRVKDGRWGKHVCDVVYSKAQFSWTLNHKKKWTQPKGELWTAAKANTLRFERGTRIRGLEQSLTYHADYIKQPSWAKQQLAVKYIGQHIFYRSVDI